MNLIKLKESVKKLGGAQNMLAWERLELYKDFIRYIEELEEEIEIDNKIIIERDKILETYPCPIHGKCVPYIFEYIEALKKTAEASEELHDWICNKALICPDKKLDKALKKLKEIS